MVAYLKSKAIGKPNSKHDSKKNSKNEIKFYKMKQQLSARVPDVQENELKVWLMTQQHKTFAK